MTTTTTKANESKTEEPTGKDRIPKLLSEQAIFLEFLSKYLEGYDEVSEYNTRVLGNKDSEWNSYKILEEARKLARPTSGEANANVKDALTVWENLVNEMNRAKQNVIQATAKELGIEYSAGSERDPEVEVALKEKRKTAINIGEQLTKIADMSMDKNLKEEIVSFLKTYEMPAVGRNQTHSFEVDGSAKTPKYRIKVTVSRNDEVVLEADGITKLVQSLPKFYERGKSPKADVFRKAWESAGNNIDETKTPTVSFKDDSVTPPLVYTLTKK